MPQASLHPVAMPQLASPPTRPGAPPGFAAPRRPPWAGRDWRGEQPAWGLSCHSGQEIKDALLKCKRWFPICLTHTAASRTAGAPGRRNTLTKFAPIKAI